MSAGKLPTVLLLDDEEHSLAAMRMALEDEFDCLTATSADEGWRLMEENHVEVIEMRILRETLTRLKWNKSRAAAELRLSRVGLRAKPDRHGIAPPVARCAEQQEEA